MRGRWLALLATGVTLASTAGSGSAAPPAPTPDPVELGRWSGVRLALPSPDWLAADADHVYVRRDSGHIDILDPATGAITATIDVEFDYDGHFCAGIGVGPAGVWSCKSTDVVQVDPASGEVGAPLGLTKAAEQGHLVEAFGRVWVLVGDGSTLAAVDPMSGALTDEIALGARCLDVAADNTSVWVVCALDDAVLRIDPGAGDVLDRMEFTEPRAVAFSEGTVWVGATGEVVRLAAETLETVATIDGGVGRAGSLATEGDDGVWVRRAGSPLVRIDAATNEITDELALGVDSGGDIVIAHGAVWTTAFDDATLFRIDLSSGG